MIEAAAIFAALPPAEETAIRSHIGELAAEVGRFVPGMRTPFGWGGPRVFGPYLD